MESILSECPACNGRGRIANETCQNCNGIGTFDISNESGYADKDENYNGYSEEFDDYN